jgi:DNA-binding Lrp family transcriptional regulator
MKEQRVLDILRAIMKNSRLSDRELAKRLHISQPTISRTRAQLEREGYIRSYTAVPEFGKVGFKIMAITFAKVRAYPSADEANGIIQKAREWLAKRPNVIYAADGQGMGGKDVVMISFHKDYDDYTRFIHSYAFEWGSIISTFETFIVNVLSELTLKPFDLTYLADYK